MYLVTKLADNNLVNENVLTHNKEDFGNKAFLKINDTAYESVCHENVKKGYIGVNMLVRNHLKIGFNDTVKLEKLEKSSNIVSELNIVVKKHGESEIINIEEDDIREFLNKRYVHRNQCLFYATKKLILIIKSSFLSEGYISKDTVINLTSDDNLINVVGMKLNSEIFRPDYKFQDIGIGGLDQQLIDILKKSLTSRAYKKEVVEKMGIKHVKGILLYGPPGTGKTLIARRIGNMLTNKKPKIINGPEIINKYVGESEKNIRDLFSEARQDAEKDVSDLHVIIFDEIDAICKTRGSNSQSGVNDNVVNQLLTMIDGYDSLDNIFIIAMTNRKDLLDPALLRAGRLEIHIEIGLPDKFGRLQIFQIHSQNMSLNNMLDPNIDFSILADKTENYSGAEIEAVVRNAASNALHEALLSDIDSQNIIVEKKHFELAIESVTPCFGTNVCKNNYLPENYDFNYHIDTYYEIFNYLKKDKFLKTVLIVGESKSGKSILARKLSEHCNIKNVKIISPVDLLMLDEIGKGFYISDIVKNSYISNNSFIVIDDIEVLLNYSELGNIIQYSNRLYQVLTTLLKTMPYKDHHISFLCTCTNVNLANNIQTYFDLVTTLSL